ncbi:DUF2934 domain-containing protein [Pseudomonas yamanorum]|uniref:DUF2934 domain-containing protein n=1 Tax=Pseudomonas yamanorum TaxID=515393 RepID=UPI003D35B5A8
MTTENNIRDRAYALWEKDSCPADAAEFYWHLASAQLNAKLVVALPFTYSSAMRGTGGNKLTKPFAGDPKASNAAC